MAHERRLVVYPASIDISLKILTFLLSPDHQENTGSPAKRVQFGSRRDVGWERQTRCINLRGGNQLAKRVNPAAFQLI